MFFIFASVTLLALLNNVQSHPSGPPHSACVDMMPRHDVEPQSRVSPYSVQVKNSKLQSGDSIEVTIRGATDDDKILGFMVQAQDEGKVVGKWIVSDTNVYGKSMHCFGADVSFFFLFPLSRRAYFYIMRNLGHSRT